jgi:monofunctional glycosyltransferase
LSCRKSSGKTANNRREVADFTENTAPTYNDGGLLASLMKKRRNFLKKAFAAFLLLFVLVGGYAAYSVVSVPNVAGLKTENPTVTALMEQRAAEQNTQARPLRTWVSFNNISPHLRNAVLVAEDGAFFQHSGVDLHELKEAVKKDWEEKRFARGASTITQQLAKNLYLSTSKNPLRKIREFFIARELEEHLGKQRIFEIYLNVIEWSSGVYGIGPAAQHYFGKSPGALLPEEAAVLAAMIPSPRSYSPSKRLTPYIAKRKADLLNRLVRYRYLTQAERDEAMERDVVFRGAKPVAPAEPAPPTEPVSSDQESTEEPEHNSVDHQP